MKYKACAIIGVEVHLTPLMFPRSCAAQVLLSYALPSQMGKHLF